MHILIFDDVCEQLRNRLIKMSNAIKKEWEKHTLKGEKSKHGWDAFHGTMFDLSDNNHFVINNLVMNKHR